MLNVRNALLGCSRCGRWGFKSRHSVTQHQTFNCHPDPVAMEDSSGDPDPVAMEDSSGASGWGGGSSDSVSTSSHGSLNANSISTDAADGGGLDMEGSEVEQREVDEDGVEEAGQVGVVDVDAEEIEVGGAEEGVVISDDESSVVEWDGGDRLDEGCGGDDGDGGDGGDDGGALEDASTGLAGYQAGIREGLHNDDVRGIGGAVDEAVISLRGVGVSEDEAEADDEDGDVIDCEGNGDGHGHADLKDLLDNMHEPIYAGARLTVLQACFLAMHEKREGRIRDGVFDRQCRVNKEVLMPKQNLYPGSVYLMRKVLGCEEVDDISIHMCVNGCQAWEHVPRREWKHHADDRCANPLCRSARFVRQVNGTLRPQKEFFYMGLQRAIQHQFCIPEFRDFRGVARPESGRYTNEYYASPECARLHEAAGINMVCSGDVDAASDEEREVLTAQWQLYQDTSVWDLGMDFFQPYQTRAYSIGLILLRCADLPDQVKNQVKFSSILGITMGPKEPPNFQAYLKPIVRELQAAWQHGLSVRVPDGSGATRAFLHHVLLGGVFADEPASKKISRWKSHGSYLACGFCNCRGVLDPTTNATVRYPPVMQYGFYSPGGCSLAHAQLQQLVYLKFCV